MISKSKHKSENFQGSLQKSIMLCFKIYLIVLLERF